jgi:hypothetical protein
MCATRTGYNDNFVKYLLHRLSRTKKCNTTKLEAVNVTKKMPSSAKFGHQNDCARSPNVERIVAAGTSSSTPYCICGSNSLSLGVRKGRTAYLIFLQLQETKLIDSERLERGMEERNSVQPLQPWLDLRSVDQKTRE